MDDMTPSGVLQSDVDEATNGMSIEDMGNAEDETGFGLGYLCQLWVGIGKPLPFEKFIQSFALLKERAK